MTFGVVLALFLLVWGTSAPAQVLAVRSGEHPTFTRLVMPLPEGADWRVQQDGPVAQLFLDRDQVAFDASRVFQRIPRDRLSAIGQNGPGQPLRLDLACNCPVTSFVERGNYLVLDIGDPVSDVPVRFGLQEADDLNINEAPKTSRAAAMVLPLLGSDPAAQLLMRRQGVPTISGHDGANDSSPSDHSQPESDEEAKDLAGSQKSIQAQIARAATQGLIDVDPAALREIETQSGSPDSLPDIQAFANIRATTSVDRDMTLAPNSLTASSGSSYCLNPDRIDITTWGDDRPFGHQVGAYRTRMAGEFDDLSTRDIRGLAKTYLYFGFGAEARQLLRDADQEDPDIRLLDAFALLLDEGQLKKPHPFDDQRHCDSAVALWSVYANPISPRDAINSGAIIRAFAEMPPHLRAHVGPGLMRRFTNAGDSETAEILQRIITRAAPREDAPMQMAEAELARLNGEEQEADALVKEVAHSGSGESPSALIELVDRHFESRKSVPTDTVQLLATYVMEMRRAEIGEDLARTHALALALAGDFHAAFDVANSLEPERAERTNGQVLELLAENADDVTFLELAFQTVAENPGSLPAKTKLLIARRFLDIGFPEKTLDLLDHTMPGKLQEEQAIMRAQAALDMGLPRRALLELVGRSGPEPDAMRAEALRMSGLHAEAAAIYSAMDAPEDAARSEWLAGVPKQPDAERTTSFSDRQEASQRLANLPERLQENTLAGARALLDQVEALRQDVSLLNADTPSLEQ